MKKQLLKEKSTVSQAISLHIKDFFVKFVTSILIKLITSRKKLVQRGKKVHKLHNYLILKHYEQTNQNQKEQ